jgi:hypothetical protein
VRDLRHFLTHRRGELRTGVIEAMDKLAAAVRDTDPTVYKYTSSRVRFSNLKP